MTRHTGPGKIAFKIDPINNVVRTWLYNFDVDGATLKTEHIDLLNSAIGPVIRDSGSMKILGLASTTGQVSHDKRLGEARIHAVTNFLRDNFGKDFTINREFSYGKQMALFFSQNKIKGGTADNTESEKWRAVVINAWNRSDAPPPPSQGDLPFNDPTWVDTLTKVIDGVNLLFGILDFVADLGELSELCKFSGPASLVTSVVDGILQMPLIWATADAYANLNGQIEGAADAIQDMADQFGIDSKVDPARMSKWPAVQVPAIHAPVNPQPNPGQAAWRAGQFTGLMNAVQAILDLEKKPMPVTLRDGQHIRVSGRLWLRSISLAFKDNVGIEVVVKAANEKLKKLGKAPFPTHP